MKVKMQWNVWKSNLGSNSYYYYDYDNGNRIIFFISSGVIFYTELSDPSYDFDADYYSPMTESQNDVNWQDFENEYKSSAIEAKLVDV